MKFKWDRKYLYTGVTAFCVIAACALLVWLLMNFATIRELVIGAWNAVLPVVYGMVLAYLLAPVCNFVEKKWFLPLTTKYSKKKPERANRRARRLSVAAALLFALILVSGLLWLVLPQIVDSLRTLVNNLPGYVKDVSNWLTAVLANFPEVQETVTTMFGDFTANLTKTITDTLLPQVTSVVTSISSGVMAAVGTIFNLFMGIVVSVYLLSQKERFLAQTKKLIYAVFRPPFANSMLKNGALAHQKFGGFITAKLIDSLIIGLITYPCVLILQMPFPALIAVIVGVTNVIPVFGPFIGAIPCAFLALMDSPLKCLIFVIFIVALQQVDGNIIGPRLLSENTGVSTFWVIVSLLVGQWMFGVVGMIIAVPLFAVLWTLVTSACDRKLKEKELPVETDAYTNLTEVDPFTNEPHYHQPDEMPKSTGFFKRFCAGKKDKKEP